MIDCKNYYDASEHDRDSKESTSTSTSVNFPGKRAWEAAGPAVERMVVVYLGPAHGALNSSGNGLYQLAS